MSPFTKVFLRTTIIQLIIVGLIAIGFFAGGPETNSLRFLIAIFGMALLLLISELGINSIEGTVAIVLTVLLSVSLLVAKIATRISTKHSE